MKVFWRAEPLNPTEVALLTAVLRAHDQSARRENVSTQAVVIGAQAADDYGKAMAGAILTLGGLHGPIERAVQLLTSPDPVVIAAKALAGGRKVPGWGNSFHRGVPDPLWLEVDAALQPTPMGSALAQVTGLLHSAGKHLFPNPAAYTAAASVVLGIPPCISPYLFLAGRLAAWTQTYAQHHQNLWD